MVWTQADWLNAVPFSRELINELTARMLAVPPNNMQSWNGMIARAGSQAREARDRIAAPPSINLHALAAAIFEHRRNIDDNRTLLWTGGLDRPMIADMGVNIAQSFHAKVRFLDFIDAECRALGNKEMENFLLYVEDVVSSMSDVFDSIQQLSQASEGP